MKGVGSSNYRPYYASSSSNLPAFSSPYGVYYRSDVSDPFLVSEESADGVPLNHPPVRSGTYGYDFFSNPVRDMDSTPSTNSYGCSNLRYIEPPSSQLPHFNSMGLASQDTCDYDICSGSIKTGIVDAEPYYPSYTVAPIHDGSSSVSRNHLSPCSSSVFTAYDGSTLNEYTKQSSKTGYSGQRCYSWNQSAEFNQDKVKQAELEGSFGSKETNITGSFVEGNLINQGCQDAKRSDDVEVLHSNKMGWEKHGVPICRGQLDNKSCWWQISKSFPVDTSSTPIQGSPSISLETHYDSPCGSFDKYLRQHDKPLWFDPKSSASMTGLVKDLNLGSHTADRDHGGNIFSNNEELYPMPSSGNTGYFDASQLHTHLKTNDLTSSTNNVVPCDKSVSRDVMDLVFKARHEFQNSQLNLDNINLTLDSNEGVNSLEKSFDNLDQCNPAGDSPCWIGVPAAHHSPLKVYTVVCPEYGRQPVEHFSSNSNNNQVQREIDNQVKVLEELPRMFPVMNCASEQCHLDGALNDGPCQYKTNCDFALQYLDDLSKMRENDMPLHQSFYDCEAGYNTNQQVIQENKLTSPEENTVHKSCADTGIKVNDCLESVTSHAAEDALSSPSAEDVPSELKTTAGKVSTAKINVQMLVDTMHNLSELLLFHCLNDVCELKEQDQNGLKNVISNLDTCISKNAEQMDPQQEYLFPHSDTSKCARESPELQQNSSFERPQLTKLESECSNLERGNPRAQEENCHFVSDKQCTKLAYSFPAWGDAERMKEDNMTEAIKRVLSKNFHDDEGSESQTLLFKNLWLKAEAELCFITYKARYNQMRTEMEKYSDKQEGVEDLPKLEVVPNLSTSPRSASKLDTSLNPSFPSEDFPLLNAAKLKEQSAFKFSPDLNKPCPLAPEVKDGQNLDSFALDSPASSISKDAGNYKASVMSRFQVLKSRVGNSDISTENLEDLSSREVSPALDKGDEISSRVGRQNQDNITLGSPMPGKNKVILNTSVISGFDLFNSKPESSSCTVPLGQVFNGVIFPANGADSTITRTASEGKALDDDMEHIIIQSHEFSSALDKGDEIASSGVGKQNQDNITLGSPLPGEKNKVILKTSVISGFDLLNSRPESSSCMVPLGQVFNGVILPANGTDSTTTRTASEGKALDDDMDPIPRHLTSCTTSDELGASNPEFVVNLEDDQEIQSHGNAWFGNSLHMYYSDGFSSDWEQV